MQNTQRIRRYENLRRVLEAKGRLPFYKQYQKYAKLMIFFYETLLEIAVKNGLQNGEGILYKIRLSNHYTIHKGDFSGKMIFECGCGRYSLFKSFEIDYMTNDEIFIMLQNFSDYYGIVLKKEDAKLYNSSREYDYKILLP